MKRLAIAMAPSYVSKTGKHTEYIGRFWSGFALAIKLGFETLGIGLIDADITGRMMFRADQTLNASKLGMISFIFTEYCSKQVFLFAYMDRDMEICK